MACSLTSPSTRGPRAREGQLGCCPPRGRVDGLEPPSSFSLRRATGRPPFWERPSRALPGLRRRSPQGWAVGPSRRKVVNAGTIGRTRILPQRIYVSDHVAFASCLLHRPVPPYQI